jgi:hypothetical protein
VSTIETEFDTPAVPVALGARNILALDLGTNCGWALCRNGSITYGTKDFSPKRSDGPGQRWLKFRALLANQYNAAGELEAVYYEEVMAHGTKENPNVIAAHIYGGFLAHLEAWCDVQRVRLVPVSVGTVKKTWTGNGKAKKDQMVAEARRRGFKVDLDADDTADALAVLHLAIQRETR